MPLKYNVDSLDSVPEPLRDNYVPDGARFRLAIDGLPEVDAPGLKSALQKERAANDGLRKLGVTPHQFGVMKLALSEFEKFGMAPDEIADMVAARDAAPEQLDTILDQHQKAAAVKIAALDAELKAARASEKDAVVQATLAAELARAKVTPEGVALLSDILADRISFSSADGKRVIGVLAADGVTPMAGSGPNGAALLGDLVKEAVGQYPSLFLGTGAGGSGKSPKDSKAPGGKILSRGEFDALGPTDRAEKMRDGYKVHD